MTTSERIRLAIRDSRNENRTVDIDPSGRADRDALYDELLTVCADCSYDLFWGADWQICLLAA